MDSILNTVKKMLGLPVADTAFDLDILVFINGAISVLSQLGVGPTTPVLVVDKDTEWTLLNTTPTILAMAQNFVFYKVKLSFDPPGNSFIKDSYQNMIQELTWRIEIEANPYIPPEEPVEV